MFSIYFALILFMLSIFFIPAALFHNLIPDAETTLAEI